MKALLFEVGESTVEVDQIGEDVALEVLEPDQPGRGYVDIRLTPGQAVDLSRALVAAAAEALGVKV